VVERPSRAARCCPWGSSMVARDGTCGRWRWAALDLEVRPAVAHRELWGPPSWDMLQLKIQTDDRRENLRSRRQQPRSCGQAWRRCVASMAAPVATRIELKMRIDLRPGKEAQPAELRFSIWRLASRVGIEGPRRELRATLVGRG
jgi:hypothetical protein